MEIDTYIPTTKLIATGRVFTSMPKSQAARLITILANALMEDRDMVFLEFDIMKTSIAVNRLHSSGLSAVAVVTDSGLRTE